MMLLLQLQQLELLVVDVVDVDIDVGTAVVGTPETIVIAVVSAFEMQLGLAILAFISR